MNTLIHRSLRLVAAFAGLGACTLAHTTFAFVLGATDSVDFKGTGITTDSFNSGDTNYSSNGRYNPAKTKDNGDIIARSGLPNTLSLGGARIMGQVRTGPGTNTITIGAKGSVGDKTWVLGGNVGIQTNHSATDVNEQWPDVTAPITTWWPASPGNYTVDGTNYQYLLQAGGNYAVGSVSGGIYVSTNASVSLLVTGNVALAADATIRVGPNARLLVYMQGATFTANGVVETASGNARDFGLYGLPGNTNITVGASFTGTIYAPSAALVLSGGNNAATEFVGVGIARTVAASGRINLHFDEALMPTPANPPTIGIQPENQTVLAGQNATFTVSARGSGPFGYQWRFNGASIATATSSTFTVTNASAGNAGLYCAVITNYYGAVTSAVATLTVINPPAFLWARSALSGPPTPGSAGSTARAVAVDGSENLFVAGAFDEPVLDLGGLALTSRGAPTFFLCKYDTAGNILWATVAGTNSDLNWPIRVATDPDGNACLAGHFAGTVTLGTNTFVSASPADLFLARFDPRGQVLWARQLGAYESAYWNSFGLATDPQGGVYLASRFDGTATLGATTISGSPAFVAKYDAAGNLVWARQASAADAVAAAANGALYVAGSPGVLAKYGPAGILAWSKTFPVGMALGLDEGENIYVTGRGLEGVYDGLTLTNVGGLPDCFIAKCSPAGQMLWLRQLGSATQQIGVGLGLDQAGDVYTVGLSATLSPDPTLSFGPITLTNVLAFMAEFDRFGNALLAQPLATTNRCFPRALAVANASAVFIGGSFRGTAHFGDFTLVDTNNSPGHGAMFVTKMAGVISLLPLLQLESPPSPAQLSFRVCGAPGFRYVIETSADLQTWAPLVTNTAPFVHTDPETASCPRRFFRAHYLP